MQLNADKNPFEVRNSDLEYDTSKLVVVLDQSLHETGQLLDLKNCSISEVSEGPKSILVEDVLDASDLNIDHRRPETFVQSQGDRSLKYLVENLHQKPVTRNRRPEFEPVESTNELSNEDDGATARQAVKQQNPHKGSQCKKTSPPKAKQMLFKNLAA